MTASTPWWYSGDEPDPDANESPGESEPPAEDESPPRGTEWSALILGAQRMVDWATERVLAPHAEHGDPRDNPACVVCRTMLLLGEVQSTAGAGEAGQAATGGADPQIQWIPIRDEAGEP